MITCSVKGCFAERATGDLYFCEGCREGWRLVCEELGISQVNIPQHEEKRLLKVFQEKALK